MPDIDLTRISRVTDAEATRLVSPSAFAELAACIIDTPVPAASRGANHLRPAARRSRLRALLTPASVVALAGAAALIVGLLIPGGSTGPNSEAAIQALSFVKGNGSITVIIRNPYADSSWYDADFARQHLDIRLELLPASPSLVGAIVGLSSDGGSPQITPINNKDACGGLDGIGCWIGFRVPAHFKGWANIFIGRPARPGEQYNTTTSAFNRGEILYGLQAQVFGHPLSQVMALFARLHIPVAQCRAQFDDQHVQSAYNCDPGKTPNWYVADVTPWAPPNQILITIQPGKYLPAGHER